MAKNSTIITGTVGQDSHVVGIKILSRYLKDEGFRVIELGCLTPPEDFIKAAQETAADAIMISSLYGMAEQDLTGFKEKCVEAGLGDVILYLGGNLAVGRHDFKDDEKKFKAIGFDRVYPPEVDLGLVVVDLEKDLHLKTKHRTKN
ncbi:MAG: Sbm [Chloroflexi bacterium]|nr:Sbm [Chloroflexota bacterium]